jgi:hypothetical protein
MRTVLKLTANDTTAPLNRMRDQLAAAELALLTRKYALSPIRRPDPAIMLDNYVAPFTRVGKPFARITITVRTNLAYAHAVDVQALGAALLKAAIANSGQQLIPGSLRVAVHPVYPGTGQSAWLHVVASASPTVDTSRLLKLIAGQSLSGAQQALDNAAGHSGWHAIIRLNPDWGRRLPITTRLITFNVSRPS